MHPDLVTGVSLFQGLYKSNASGSCDWMIAFSGAVKSKLFDNKVIHVFRQKHRYPLTRHPTSSTSKLRDHHALRINSAATIKN